LANLREAPFSITAGASASSSKSIGIHSGKGLAKWCSDLRFQNSAKSSTLSSLPVTTMGL
jgi:hypothetical protein